METTMTITETCVSTPAKSAEPGQTVDYQSGFGNDFESEALSGALPIGRNSPQRCAYGLYAEQLSGSPFTAPRASNERSWLYRIRPTVANWGRFAKADAGLWRTAPCAEVEIPPAPMRWDPIPLPSEGVSLIEGIRPLPRPAMPAVRPAWRRTFISPPARWRTSTSTTPTAR
jgi:homogentisate 1,2-dioxygenase